MDKDFPISTYAALFILSFMADILTFFSSLLLGVISDLAFTNIYTGAVVLGAEILFRLTNLLGFGIVLPSDIFLILIVFPIIISFVTCELFIIILASTENSIPKYYYFLTPFIAILASIPFISGYFFWVTLTFYLVGIEAKQKLIKNKPKKKINK